MQYLYDLIWPISSRDNAEKNDCLQDQISCEGPPVTWQQRTVLVLKHMIIHMNGPYVTVQEVFLFDNAV